MHTYICVCVCPHVQKGSHSPFSFLFKVSRYLELKPEHGLGWYLGTFKQVRKYC